MRALWVGLRHASVRQLGVAAAAALLGAVVLDRQRVAAGGFFVAVLFGLGVGLGVMALGVWQRRRQTWMR